MRTLGEIMAAIRTGRESQFAPLIRVPVSNMVAGVQVRIDLPGLFSNLWMPPTYIIAGAILANPGSTILGIRINLEDALMLPWGQLGNNLSSFTGPVERIFATYISGTQQDVYLNAARGIGVAYSGAETAAGTPSSSPEVGFVGHGGLA